MKPSIKPILRAVVALQREDLTALDLADTIEVTESAAYSYIREMSALGLIEPCGSVARHIGPKPIIWKWKLVPVGIATD